MIPPDVLCNIAARSIELVMPPRMRILSLTVCLMFSASWAGQPNRPFEFNRDIRPILSDACFNCHGPDKSKRKADLHFDVEEGARGDRGGYFVIVPGKPDESEMLKRVASADPKKRMPPPSAGPALTKEQVESLRQWIAQGAKWQKHWSLIPPVRLALPPVKLKGWAKNPIDDFVLARLEKEGLKPTPQADAATLIRRLSLDLTGLPPTPAEVDAFVNEYQSATPQAKEAVYGKLVDRLLRSPRYGERMAQRWLDAARYADTNGYQTDGDRVMWRWRDWVIEAFNENIPFDQFTIEQLAGDMLPKPTLEQRIATGFNRNHRGNSEGGVIPEEYAVEYVVDRVDTTATVWLGLTAACGKCHNHKFDPISQKEFYQLFAYFNNVPEKGKAIKYGNSPPYIKAPTREQQVQRKLLESQLRAAKAEWQKLQPELVEAQKHWETRTDRVHGLANWVFERGLQAHFNHDGKPVFPHGAVQIQPGKVGHGMGLGFDGECHVETGNDGGFGFLDKFTIGAWVSPGWPGNLGKAGPILSRMVDADQGEGYSLVLRDGKVQVNLVKRWLDDAIRVETAAGLAPNQWHHVMFSYDGSRVAAGVKIYVDGELQKLKINLDDLNQSFATKEPFRIGAGGGIRFHGIIDDVRIYDRVLSGAEIALVATTDTIPQVVAIAPSRRTPGQVYKLRTCFLEQYAPAAIQAANIKLRQARQELTKFDESIPTTMVMEEMPTPRETHVLVRGEYDKPGPRVFPGIPAALGSLPKELPNNRLGFAQWLVRRDNPLTARVAVNRYWQMLFGTGIVKTVEDFGAQGEWPSYPELLDWLAVEFTDPSGDCCLDENAPPESAPKAWDIKHILKTIVTSATYRQSSQASKDLLQRDPENRLLARGPRFRLSADMIRDQALYASGLLVERIGGPSVKPYSPPGLIKELHGTDEDAQDHGASLYRRSLYTYWKRTVAPPALMTFDAANRETCVVRETRTNTPLQALNLLNDVTYVEAARVLAQRVMKEAGPKDQDRVTLAFRLTTCRKLEPRELAILQAGLERHRQRYRQDAAAALKIVSRGEYPRDAVLPVSELAAFTALCNTLLNLDEVITKE
jgi:Protein of unknown function (DUF1553)/Protein of unknown function (DUF1549)/Concanavalin A-like lectin/glucanases superfamily/Planctomycete cytochrome C